MNEDGIVVIPQSIEEFVENYPDEARTIACRKNIHEYNHERERMKESYGHSIVQWMDTSGIVAKTKELNYFLTKRGHRIVDNLNNNN